MLDTSQGSQATKPHCVSNTREYTFLLDYDPTFKAHLAIRHGMHKKAWIACSYRCNICKLAWDMVHTTSGKKVLVEYFLGDMNMVYGKQRTFISNMYHGLAKNFLDIDPLSNANKDLDG